MRLEDLSKKDWAKLQKYIYENLGPNEGDREFIFDLVKNTYLTRGNSSSVVLDGFVHSVLRDAFKEPFRDIPILMGNSCSISSAVYKFRLDLGL